MNRNYYAVLPASVRYDKNLTPNAKLLYAEITALCNEKGFCWATNGYFADLYGVSKTSIYSWLKNLKENGYINIKLFYSPDGKVIENRYIFLKEPVNFVEKEYNSEMENGEIEERETPLRNLNDSLRKLNTPIKKSYSPHQENLIPPLRNLSAPHQENLVDNNTFNNTKNNTKNNTVNSIGGVDEDEPRIDNESLKNKKTKTPKQPKKTKTYSDNSELDEAIKGFIDNRKVLKAAMSERAIKLFINKIDREFETDEEKIEAIDIAIMRGWRSIEKAWVDNLKATSNKSMVRTLEDSKKIAEERWKGFLNAEERWVYKNNWVPSSRVSRNGEVL